MRILQSVLITALVASAPLCALSADSPTTPDTATIGFTQTMTVSPKDMAALREGTKKYLDAALNDDKAFYAALTPDYVGVTMSGKQLSAGQVYGAVQVLKLPLSGIVTSLKVVDAHRLGNLYDETAIVSGTADTIDSGDARKVNATWIHKITFKKDGQGDLLIQRDEVLSRF